MEYIEKKKRIFYEGVELAAFYASYPSFPSLDNINSLCERLVENSFSWFCGKFYERVFDEYIKNDDPQKRFNTGKYAYDVRFSVEQEGEERIEIKLSAILKRAKNEELARYENKLCFDVESQLIVKKKR